MKKTYAWTSIHKQTQTTNIHAFPVPLVWFYEFSCNCDIHTYTYTTSQWDSFDIEKQILLLIHRQTHYWHTTHTDTHNRTEDTTHYSRMLLKENQYFLICHRVNPVPLPRKSFLEKKMKRQNTSHHPFLSFSLNKLSAYHLFHRITQWQ